jgi:hypothetical protein
MNLHQLYGVDTVGKLKELLKDLPDDMEVSRLHRGERLHLDVSIQLRGKGNQRKTVSRGGVEFLAVSDF